MAKEFGEFYSWTILSENIACKECDKSIYKNSVTGIPIEIRWFFHCESLNADQKKEVTLIHTDIQYKAIIENYTHTNRTRMRIKNGFKEIAKQNIGKKELLVFERIDDDKYLFYFINKEDKWLLNSLGSDNENIIPPSIDEDTLLEIAKIRSKRNCEPYIVETKVYHRDPIISAVAKRRANGKCQLCGQDAPFITTNGEPYLESHHLIWLSDGGKDSIDNVVALCPNCHRKMHYCDEPKDFNHLMAIIDEYKKEYDL